LVQASQGHDLIQPWIRLTDDTAAIALLLFLGWLIGRNGYLLMGAGIWNKPGPQRSDIDLLNLENIYVFGRSGLNGSLVWFIGVAIAALLILPGLGSGIWILIPIFVMSFGGGLGFFLEPANQVRRLIRDVKREELARLEPLLRQARDEYHDE